jgi:O-antigen/teichoic acid export membrane protein
MEQGKIRKIISLSSFREASLIWISMVFGAIFAFLTQALLARTISVNNYGAMATVISITAMIGPTASLGVGGYWLLIFGHEGWRARRWLGSSLRLVLLSSSVSMSLLLIWAALGCSDEITRKLVYWLFPIIPMQALIELNISKFQLEGKYRVLAIWQFLPHAARAIVVLLAMIFGFNFYFIAIGYSISTMMLIIINIILLIPTSKGFITLKGHGTLPSDNAHTKDHLEINIGSVMAGAWPFGLSGILGLLYGRSDTVMLGLLQSTESAGIYYAAVSVLTAIYLLPDAITQKYLLPKIQRWSVHDPIRFLEVFRFGNGIMLLFGVLAMLCLGISGPVGLPLLFGKAYNKSGMLLLFLSPCIPLRFLAASVGTSLATGANMKRKNIYQGFVVMINVSLNLLLIPFMGIYGAAIAKIASELSLLIFYLIGARKFVFGNDAWRGWTLKMKMLNA